MQSKFLYTLLLFVAFFLPQQSLCQSFALKNFTVENGLPSNETYDVFQDSKGFIWIATDNGVVKYDGRDFEIFKTAEGLQDPVVFEAFEDHSGKIWFRTYSGRLFYYLNGKIHAYRFNKETLELCGKSLMENLFVDSLNQVWFSTNSTFVHIDSSGKVSKESISERMYEIRNIGKNFIFAAGRAKFHDIRYLILGADTIPLPHDSSMSSPVQKCARVNNKFFFSTNGSVYQVDHGKVTTIVSEEQSVISLYADSKNHIWIGAKGIELKRFEGRTLQRHWVPTELKNFSVTKVIEDNHGGYWFSTLEKGAFYFPNFSIQNRTMDSKVRSAMNVNDKLFMGTYSGDLLEAVNAKKIITKNHFDQPITMLHGDRNGTLWVSTDSVYAVKNNLFTTVDDAAIAAIFEDSLGIVHTLSKRGLSVFDNYKSKLNVIRRDYYRGIVKIGNLYYVAGRLGLTKFNANFDPVGEIKLYEDTKISCLQLVNDSTLFVGTTGYGLSLFNFKRETQTGFNISRKFMADNIYSIVQTDSAIFLGTEKGVFIGEIQSFFKENPSFDRITTDNGLISNKVNVVALTDSLLWIFTDQGISTIPVTELGNSKSPIPTFYLRNIVVNDERWPDAPLNLRYDQNHLKVTFGFISVQNQDIKIKYRLKSEQQWAYTTERTLEFSQLAPSNYNLEIQYSINNNAWISASVLNFMIHPPWWNTWLFRLSATVVFLSMMFLLFRSRIRNMQKIENSLRIINQQQQELIHAEINAQEKERKRIARDLHDSVGSNLTAMKMKVNLKLRKYGDDHTEIENGLQDVIKEVKGIINDLAPPGLQSGLFAALQGHVEKLAELNTKILLTTYGEDLHDPDKALAIFRTLQELISNSLKHSQAKTISIEVSTFEDLITIIYEDNGIGFSKESVALGHGLLNLEARINSLNGTLNFESGYFGCSYAIEIPINT